MRPHAHPRRLGVEAEEPDREPLEGDEKVELLVLELLPRLRRLLGPPFARAFVGGQTVGRLRGDVAVELAAERALVWVELDCTNRAEMAARSQAPCLEVEHHMSHGSTCPFSMIF